MGTQAGGQVADCASSRVQNISGSRRRFSYFYGTILNPGDTFEVSGDIYSWFVSKYPGIKGKRVMQFFSDDVDNGVLRIIKLPTAPCGDMQESSSQGPNPWSSSSSTNPQGPPAPWSSSSSTNPQGPPAPWSSSSSTNPQGPPAPWSSSSSNNPTPGP